MTDRRKSFTAEFKPNMALEAVIGTNLIFGGSCPPNPAYEKEIPNAITRVPLTHLGSSRNPAEFSKLILGQWLLHGEQEQRCTGHRDVAKSDGYP